MESAVRKKVLVRDADNYVVWVGVDPASKGASQKDMISLLQAELQTICTDHVSTLDDRLMRSNPRPNPVPRIFVEQGNELSRVLWLSWEE